MRTRAVANATAALLAAFLMGLGPPAAAGLSPLTDVQITPNVNEGDTAHLTGSINQQCATGETLTVNWGDGSPTEEFTGLPTGPFDVTHVYVDDDPTGTPGDNVSVSVVLTDTCDHSPAQGGARTFVHNVDPAFGHFGVIPHGVGQATRLEVDFTDPGANDTFTVTIDWGDGSQNTVLLLPHIQKIRQAHRYMALGEFKIAVSVQDDDTGLAEDSISFDVPHLFPRIVTGPGKGYPALVKTFDGGGKPLGPNFLAQRSSFTGGVRVAVGDVTGDGYADIVTGAGPGAGPLVRIWHGPNFTRAGGFFPYRTSFTGGVFVAAGDLNGDGYDEIITAPGSGAAPLVKVFDGRTGKRQSSFFAYNSSFTGGVRVAVGDVNGDGTPEIITGAGPGAGPHVKVFSGRGGLLESFLAYNSSFTGGVFVAAGDVNGDGRADAIIGPDVGAGPLVKVFSFGDPAGGESGLIQSFFAYNSSFTGGVRVAAGDVNGDGRADIIAGPGPSSHIDFCKVFNSSVDGGTLATFQPYNSSFQGGVYVAFGATKLDPGT